MRKDLGHWVWSAFRGVCVRGGPQSFPEGLGTVATNLELRPNAIGKRRPSTTDLSLTSGPSARVHHLAVHRPTSSGALAPELWAFSNTSTMVMHRRASGTWNSVSISDTPSGSAGPCAVTLNNKFFIAYNSSVNRLHVWDGSALRRVGLSKPSAPTAADGAGAGADVNRYYRVSFLIMSGSDIVVESELSEAVLFNPAAANSAVVTKPTTVDSATHWRVWAVIASSGDTYDLYQLISSNIVVATTTYEDTVAPASYSGDAPARLGMHIPPPSCKFIVADVTGNRLVMAGAHETSGSAGETLPKTSRVWFTRPLGASDNGDDETIPNVEATATLDGQKNWIDVGENDGDIIYGLGVLGTAIYVFKARHIYALYPTNIDTAPYRQELISVGIGLATTAEFVPHRTIVSTGDALYFSALSGPYRLSPLSLEKVGFDIASDANVGPTLEVGGFDALHQRVIWLDQNSVCLWVYTPAYARRSQDEGWRGGWVKWTPTVFGTPSSLVMWEALDTTVLYPTWGGSHTGSAKIEHFSAATASDAGGTFTVTATSGPFRVLDGLVYFSADPPLIDGPVNTDVTPNVTYLINYGAETRLAASPAFAGTSHTSIKVTSLQASNAFALQCSVAWDSDQTGQVYAVTIPYRPQEWR